MTAMILWAEQQYGVRYYSVKEKIAAYLTRHQLRCF